MSIKIIVREAMNKNVLGFEEALKEELRSRLGESLANWNVGTSSIPKKGPFKLKKIVAMSSRGKTYTYDDEGQASQWHGKDVWEKMKAGVDGWKVDLDNKKQYLESVEQIDEISGETLGSYIKKAMKSSDKARDIENRAYEKANWETNPRKADRLYDLTIKASKTVDKRDKGISKAIDKLSEAFLNEAAHVWYDVGHWGSGDKRFGPIDAAERKGEDIAHAATHKEYKHLPDRYVGIPVHNKDLIAHMDKHAKLADISTDDTDASTKRLSRVKKFGDYELTVMQAKSKDEKGDITKAFAHVRNMEKLGIPHHNTKDYGQTVAIEVHNTKTGDTTKHHAYQADMSSRPDEKHLRAVSVRSVGVVGVANKPHAEIIRKFLEQN